MSQLNDGGLAAMMGAGESLMGQAHTAPVPDSSRKADVRICIPAGDLIVSLDRIGVTFSIDTVKAWNRWVDIDKLPLEEGMDRTEKVWNFLRELSGTDRHNRAEAWAFVDALEKKSTPLHELIFGDPSLVDDTDSTVCNSEK